MSELAPLRFADWLAAAEAHYARLATDGPVVVAGLSMGSLLALQLAASHPHTTAGVIVLSNAVWLKSPWPTLPLKLIDRMRLPDFWVSKSGPDLGDAEQRALHLTYNAQPIRAAISLLRAGESLSTKLHHVKAPTYSYTARSTPSRRSKTRGASPFVSARSKTHGHLHRSQHV